MKHALFFGLTLVLLFAGCSSGPGQTQASDFVSSQGLFVLPLNVSSVVFSAESVSGRVSKFSFETLQGKISSLLYLPEDTGKYPAVVLLPGAGVKKEEEQNRVDFLLSQGWAVFVIDSRGVGESNNEYQGQDQSYFQYLMLVDAVKAFNVVKKQPGIDGDRVVFMGESMGGRTAIMAAALLPEVKAVFGISTGGYNAGRYPIATREQRAAKASDPDSYLTLLPPRKLVLVYSVNDQVIPTRYPQATFAAASEPKAFYTVGCATHGYCSEMNESLARELREL